jgi:adenine-specific DNA-methyltransferase
VKKHSKKELGQYFTPNEAAQIISSWAIRRPDERILEPSFGACDFLEAATNRLGVLGSPDPTKYLYGCDIDEDVFTDYLEPKLGIKRTNPHFLHRDFLVVKPIDFGSDLFDVVIGNPPYISYHNMTLQIRQVTEQLVRRNRFILKPKASLWAYFLLHAISFLKEGGRMAWILPSSFLFAEYAGNIKTHIANSFERVFIVQLGQRLFLSEGTEEISAILLAENKRSGIINSHIQYDYVNTLSDLEGSIEAWQGGQTSQSYLNGRISSMLLSEEARLSMQIAETSGQVVTLGSVAKISIGIVTGVNKFFILDLKTARANSLPDSCLRPVLSKFSMAPGALLTSEDMAQARTENRKCLLVDTDHPDLNRKGSALRKYLASMPRMQRRKVKTFKKRSLWHRPDDGRIPNAFFPYMYHHGPRIILNEAGTTSTNTIHRMYFEPLFKPNEIAKDIWEKACAISILSTYSQLSGEHEGRSYGAGVLKHEPSEASRIRLILPETLDKQEVETTFQQIDLALRNNKHEDARRYADNFVLKSTPVDERNRIICSLEKALDETRSRRRRN